MAEISAFLIHKGTHTTLMNEQTTYCQYVHYSVGRWLLVLGIQVMFGVCVSLNKRKHAATNLGQVIPGYRARSHSTLTVVHGSHCLIII